MLLRPIVRLMNQLKYPQKLYIIVLLFVIPICALTTWIMHDISERISRGDVRQNGLQYHNALQHIANDTLMIRNTYIHQILADSSNNKPQRDKWLQSVKERAVTIQSLDHQFSKKVTMMDQWEPIRKQLIELDQKSGWLAPMDAISLYNQAINDTYSLMAHVADVSGIRQLRDEQGRLLGNAVADRLPEALMQLDSILNIGINVSASRTIMMEQKLRLSRLLEAVRRHANSLEANSTVLLTNSEDPIQLGQNIRSYKNTVDEFGSVMEGALTYTLEVPFTSLEAYQSGDASIQAVNRLYDSFVPMLNLKLQEQTDEYERMQLFILLLLLAGLALIACIFTGFYLSVVNTVSELQRTSMRIASGDLSARVNLHTKDELKSIETAYNVMAGVFEKLMAEKEEAEESIKLKAYYDALTGLPNRFLLEDRLRLAISHAQRSKTMIGILFIDLDGFKQINDTLGHHTGDRLLQSMASRLTSCLRESDTVSRVGGDEFIVLLTDLTEHEHALNVANKLIGVLQNTYVIGGNQVEVSASIGVSMYPKDGTDWELLVQKADTAMYNVKSSGKNGVLFATEPKGMQLEHRAQLEEELARGLEQKEFEIFYQPMFDLKTGHISGMEALLRWNHPERGLLLPVDFLDSLQENGWIIQLDEYTLNEVCKQNKRWQEEIGLFIPIAVNVYLHSGWRERLAPTVTSILGSVGLSPEYLEIEITESRIFQNLDVTLPQLDKLRNAGIKVMLDDFGTELSSYNQLKRLPIYGIKIDRSFVKDIPQGKKDRAITSSIVTLARELQLKVVAEGVETAEQYDFLKKLEYGDAQGYYFSTPLSAATMTELISVGSLQFPRQAYL